MSSGGIVKPSAVHLTSEWLSRGRQRITAAPSSGRKIIQVNGLVGMVSPVRGDGRT